MTEIIITMIKTTKTATIREKIITRITIILINKTLAYVNQDYLTFLNAQGVINVIIDDDNNTHSNLISENEEVDHAKIIPARTSIAFELTRVNSRLDISRAKVIREDTHTIKTGEDLIRINAIP